MLIIIYHMELYSKIAYSGCSYMEKMCTLPFFVRISQIHMLDASLYFLYMYFLFMYLYTVSYCNYIMVTSYIMLW